MNKTAGTMEKKICSKYRVKSKSLRQLEGTNGPKRWSAFNGHLRVSKLLSQIRGVLREFPIMLYYNLRDSGGRGIKLE
jgi:hypothetical protein